MKISKIYTLFFICLSFVSFGQEDIMINASENYEKGEFNKSIELYDSLLNSGFHSASLYYNLGNSYFKTDDFGNAMLYFEKALKYDPNNKDIQQNIYLTKRKIDSEIVELPVFFLKRWWNNISNIFSLGIWTFFSILFMFTFVISIGLLWFYKTGILTSYTNYFIIISLILFTISAFASNTVKNQIFNNKNAILIKENDIYTGPDTRSEILYKLMPGEKLILEDSLENWYKVQLMNKEIGWINKKDLLKI